MRRRPVCTLPPVGLQPPMTSLLAFPATAETPLVERIPEVSTKLIEPTDYLFTYGTLLRGGPRSQVLQYEAFEGEAYITDAQLFDTGHGFPAIFVGREGMVWGEVYRIVHPSTWATLDRIENGLYERVARRVHLPGKAPMARHPLAQLYVGKPEIFRPETLKLIAGGRWNANA